MEKSRIMQKIIEIIGGQDEDLQKRSRTLFLVGMRYITYRKV